MRYAAALALSLLPASALAQALPPSSTFNNLTLYGAFKGKRVTPLDMEFRATPNPNAIVAAVGNGVVFCPALSCFAQPNPENQRASLLVSSETQTDGQAEEQTLAVTTTVKTGQLRTWAPNTAFAVGDNVEFHDSRNAVYRATQAGTSAASGTGPGGTGAGIVDGTVRWQWVNAAAINGKVGFYNEVQGVPGGGKMWGQANNVEMRPGYVPNFVTALELDLTNNSGTDCAVGVANCNGLYMRTYGTNKVTSTINVEGPDDGAARGIFGLYMHGSRLSSDATIEVDTSGLAGLRFGGFIPAGYAQAAIVDQSASTRGILLAGTYGTAQISGTGWQVNPDGGVLFKDIEIPVGGALYERQPTIPVTAGSPCITGQRSWDANYEYRCISTNTWKRAALSSW